MIDLCLESISFWRRSRKNSSFCHCKFFLITISKEKVDPSEKVTPSDDVKRGTNILNYTEYPVVTIRRKDLNKFQGQSAGSKVLLNLHHEWLKRKFYILEPDFYLKNVLKVKI